MKFNAGDRVEVFGLVESTENNGIESVIVEWDEFNDGWALEFEFYDSVFDGANLRLIYDGHEKTEWDESIFKPRVLERT